jgi:hypothetical protein
MSHQLGYFSWMLSFDIRSLESHAVVVDDDLSADDPVWERAGRKAGGQRSRLGAIVARRRWSFLLARPDHRRRRTRLQPMLVGGSRARRGRGRT